MTPQFSESPQDGRREELVAATLRIIARSGVKSATVRAIAQEANVTLGLIRYYFNNKEELIVAAFEQHMTNLIDIAASGSEGDFSSAKRRLAMFVYASVRPPIIDKEVIAVWSAFFQLLFHNEVMRESHKRTYHLLRNQIEQLIRDVYREEGIAADEQQLRLLSIACNAVLDGLWLEGGVIADEFADNELVDTVLLSFSRIIGVDLAKSITER